MQRIVYGILTSNVEDSKTPREQNIPNKDDDICWTAKITKEIAELLDKKLIG